MTISGRSSLKAVAYQVGDALDRAGIRAVLTGGSCATLHSDETYVSRDLDFVIQSETTQKHLDETMRSLGYRRDGQRYVHPDSPFFVEFPPGPLAVGGEHGLAPVVLRLGRARLHALSPTDSCRDRLSAFYHWNDRASLAAAVQIARRRRVNMKVIERWSREEGMAERFQEFTRARRDVRPVRPRARSRPDEP